METKIFAYVSFKGMTIGACSVVYDVVRGAWIWLWGQEAGKKGEAKVTSTSDGGYNGMNGGEGRRWA